MKTMNILSRILSNAGAACAISAAVSIGYISPPKAGAAEASSTLTPEEASQLGTEAYLGSSTALRHGNDQARDDAYAREPSGAHAPMGQFARLRAYPTAATRYLAGSRVRDGKVATTFLSGS